MNNKMVALSFLLAMLLYTESNAECELAEIQSFYAKKVECGMTKNDASVIVAEWFDSFTDGMLYCDDITPVSTTKDCLNPIEYEEYVLNYWCGQYDSINYNLDINIEGNYALVQAEYNLVSSDCTISRLELNSIYCVAGKIRLVDMDEYEMLYAYPSGCNEYIHAQITDVESTINVPQTTSSTISNENILNEQNIATTVLQTQAPTTEDAVRELPITIEPTKPNDEIITSLSATADTIAVTRPVTQQPQETKDSVEGIDEITRVLTTIDATKEANKVETTQAAVSLKRTETTKVPVDVSTTIDIESSQSTEDKEIQEPTGKPSASLGNTNVPTTRPWSWF